MEIFRLITPNGTKEKLLPSDLLTPGSSLSWSYVKMILEQNVNSWTNGLQPPSIPALWRAECALMKTMTFHDRRCLLEWPGLCLLHLAVSLPRLTPRWAHPCHCRSTMRKHLLCTDSRLRCVFCNRRANTTSNQEPEVPTRGWRAVVSLHHCTSVFSFLSIPLGLTSGPTVTLVDHTHGCCCTTARKRACHLHCAKSPFTSWLLQ